MKTDETTNRNERAAEIENAVRRNDAEKNTDRLIMAGLDKVADAITKVASTCADLARRMDKIEARGEAEPKHEEKSEEPGTPVPIAADSMRWNTPEARAELANAQFRADGVAMQFGLQAPPPMAGEHLADYRKRLLIPFRRHSEKFKDINLDGLVGAHLDAVESQIFADAIEASRKVEAPTGTLMSRKRHDNAGHTIIEYFGSPAAWMSDFAGNRQRASGNWKTGANGL